MLLLLPPAFGGCYLNLPSLQSLAGLLEQDALRCQCFLIREVLSSQIIVELNPVPCFRGAIATHCRWHLYCSNSYESKCCNSVLLGAHFKEGNTFLNLGKRPILKGS